MKKNFRIFDEKKVIWKFSYNNIIEGVKRYDVLNVRRMMDFNILIEKKCDTVALIVSKMAESWSSSTKLISANNINKWLCYRCVYVEISFLWMHFLKIMLKDVDKCELL